MKNCDSTASKSLGQLVGAIDSTSLDRATTSSVVQQNAEQNCQHFSLRGYVAGMRINNPEACNPFDHLENSEIIWKQLRGPLDVPRKWWRCHNCVRGVDHSSSSADHQRLNAQQTSLQLCIPVPEKNSSVEHRADGGDTNKAPVEVIILDDSEDEAINEQTEKRPCLDKGKKIITEVLDNGQTSRTFQPSQNINRGPLYGKAALDDLNSRIARAADILRNQQQERRNISSSRTLDLSLSLCCPGTKGNQVENEDFSVVSHRKRKGTVDVKSRRLIQMGEFLEKPFNSCEIIDLESPSSSTHGSTRPVASANNSKAHFSRREILTPLGTAGSGENPQVRNVINLAAQHMGRPLDDIYQVCRTNENPADFSEAVPENIYMR